MRRHAPGARRAFTLIELLVVIAIIMAIMGMALPNFIAMSKERRWTSAFTDIQGFVWRARALATNTRKDMAIEFFCQGDNGTWMWVESESNLWERIPNLETLETQLGGSGPIAWIMFGEWYYAGGDSPGAHWTGGWYVNLGREQIPPHGRAEDLGDNAYQTETVKLSGGLTIDDSSVASPDFVNWDAWSSVKYYGGDNTKDLRIATNGALVQTREPTLCVRQIKGTERRKWLVVRCTGRLVPTR